MTRRDATRHDETRHDTTSLCNQRINMQDNNSRAIGEIRHETQLLFERLIKLQHQETVTLDELSQVAGIDVRSMSGRGLLRTARKRAEEHFGEYGGGLLSTVIGVGVKRLSPGDQPAEIDRKRGRIRRAARREFNRSRYVEWAQLDDAQRAALNGTRSVLHFVARATTDNRVKRLAEATKDAGTSLAFKKTLEMFSK